MKLNQNTGYNPHFKSILPVYAVGSKSHETTMKVMEHFQEIVSHDWKPGSNLANLKQTFIKHLKMVEDSASTQIKTLIIKDIDNIGSKPSMGYFATDDTAINIKLARKNDADYEVKVLNNDVNRAKFLSKNPQIQTPYMGMYISYTESAKGIQIADVCFTPIAEAKFKPGTCIIV